MRAPVVTVALTLLSGTAVFTRAVGPAVPIEPVAAILDAFRTHQIVALGEGTHGNEQGHALRLQLIRDPRFPTLVNDIVVESGNALYQDVIDRFVQGEDVPSAALRRVWQDTTQPVGLWDAPIYEELFRTVRAVNASLPDARHIRVLLGDPPIDWDTIKSAQDYKAGSRDDYPAELVRREVLAKGRKALVIYGDLHLVRRNPAKPDEVAGSIVGLLERTGAPKAFTVRTIAYGIDLETLQHDVLTWPRPSLTLLRGTTLGRASFWDYYPRPLVVGPDGKPTGPSVQRPALAMEEQFDALLYLGPQSTITRSELPRTMCSDAAYMAMRVQRLTMMGMTRDLEQLNDRCPR